MRLMVIGDPKREKKDKPLVKNSVFTETIYAPIDKVRIETGFRTRVIYKNPVDVDAVLPIPTRRYRDMFLSVVTTLHKQVYLPYDSDGLLTFSKNVVALPRLRELGFVTRDNQYGINPGVFRRAEFDFPVEILMGGKKVVAENRKQLKDFIRLRKSGQGIIVREVVNTPVTESLVVGDEVVGTVLHGRKPEKGEIDEDMERLMVDAVKILGSAYGSVRVCDNEIVSVSLQPDFAMFNSVHRKRISDSLLLYMSKNISEEYTVLDTLVDILGRAKLRLD